MIRRLVPLIESKIHRLQVPLAVQSPTKPLIGSLGAPVKMSFLHWSSLTRLRAGQIGALAEEFVGGKLHLEAACAT